MAQSQDRRQGIYLPEGLRAKLDRIADYPLTLVAAPMGYGKTTALKGYFRSGGAGMTVLWQQLLGGGAAGFWEDFCAAFRQTGDPFCEALEKTQMPGDSARQRAFLRGFWEFCRRQESPVAMVFDRVGSDLYPEIRDFLHFFVQSLPENFHLILAGRSQELRADDFFRLYGLANCISQEDFELSAKDIERYFKSAGITLAPAQAQRLYERSSGWIAILQMNLRAYAEQGGFLTDRETFRILERSLLARLPEREREFLSTVSVADGFSMEQAEFLWGGGDAGALLGALEGRGLFIRYDRAGQCYRLSPAFAAYYEEQNRRLPEQERYVRLDRLAEWYLKNDENALARRLYHRIKNFDALMDAVEKRRFLVLYGLDEQEFVSYYTDCPAQIRAKHPKAILTFARQMFAFGCHEMGREACEEFEEIMRSQDFSEETRTGLTGTYELLLCYARYNDLAGMLSHIYRAKALLEGRRAAIPWPDTGLNDSLSLLYMYHRRPGDLQREALLFAEYNPVYSSLIGGRLDGADLVLQAEALYVACDLQGAQIALHKARLAVHRDKQWHTWLCMVMLLMRIALMQGEWRPIEHLLGEVEESVSQKREYRIVPATDILEIFLYSKLGQPQRIRSRFDVHLAERFSLCFRAAPMLYCVQAEGLLAKGQYLQLLAVSEKYLEASRVYPNVYAELVLHIEIAGAYEGISRREEAEKHLKLALDLALPDHILVPFAELGRYIRGTLEALGRQGRAPELARILQMEKAYAQQARRIVDEHFSESAHGLTGRETEIAKLAAKRLSNREIADRLVISESTVKTQLARAFSKLEIKKRRDLNRFFPEK